MDKEEKRHKIIQRILDVVLIISIFLLIYCDLNRSMLLRTQQDQAEQIYELTFELIISQLQVFAEYQLLEDSQSCDFLKDLQYLQQSLDGLRQSLENFQQYLEDYSGQ